MSDLCEQVRYDYWLSFWTRPSVVATKMRDTYSFATYSLILVLGYFSLFAYQYMDSYFFRSSRAVSATVSFFPDALLKYGFRAVVFFLIFVVLALLHTAWLKGVGHFLGLGMRYLDMLKFELMSWVPYIEYLLLATLCACLRAFFPKQIIFMRGLLGYEAYEYLVKVSFLIIYICRVMSGGIILARWQAYPKVWKGYLHLLLADILLVSNIALLILICIAIFSL